MAGKAGRNQGNCLIEPAVTEHLEELVKQVKARGKGETAPDPGPSRPRTPRRW